MSKIRLFFWRIGFWPEKECPYCHGELLPHGFEGNNRVYTCKLEGCEFNGQT